MVSPEGKSIIDRAKRLYADRLQSDLERDHCNRFVSIEPESGEFFLGDTLDTDRIDAQYDSGVLTLRIPIAERAKPRKIAINSGDEAPKQIDA